MIESSDIDKRMRKVQEIFERTIMKLDELKKKQDDLVREKRQQEDSNRLTELRKKLSDN